MVPGAEFMGIASFCMGAGIGAIGSLVAGIGVDGGGGAGAGGGGGTSGGVGAGFSIAGSAGWAIESCAVTGIDIASSVPDAAIASIVLGVISGDSI